MQIGPFPKQSNFYSVTMPLFLFAEFPFSQRLSCESKCLPVDRNQLKFFTIFVLKNFLTLQGLKFRQLYKGVKDMVTTFTALKVQGYTVFQMSKYHNGLQTF